MISHTDAAAAYPRAKRLSNGEILLGYHHSGGLGEYGTFVTLRRSRDNGATWYDTRDVEGPEGDRYWGFSNVDFVETKPGRLLMVTAGRGRAVQGEEEIPSECARSGLRLRFSDDYGVTWGEPTMVASGRGRVWEPSLVMLPSGDLEIYYANEAWASETHKTFPQQIEMIRSSDGGHTWSEPRIISRVQGRRIGMPAAALLKSGQVACVEEAVGDSTSPWVVLTQAGIRGERYLAQRRYGFGSAPFLLANADGSTMLTYHSLYKKAPPPENAEIPWMFQNIWVQKGDSEAREFGDATCPWPNLPRGTGAFFPSLMMRDASTVVVMASFRTDGPDGVVRTVVRWMEGKLRSSGTAVAVQAPKKKRGVSGVLPEAAQVDSN